MVIVPQLTAATSRVMRLCLRKPSRHPNRQHGLSSSEVSIFLAGCAAGCVAGWIKILATSQRLVHVIEGRKSREVGACRINWLHIAPFAAYRELRAVCLSLEVLISLPHKKKYLEVWFRAEGFRSVATSFCTVSRCWPRVTREGIFLRLSEMRLLTSPTIMGSTGSSAEIFVSCSSKLTSAILNLCAVRFFDRWSPMFVILCPALQQHSLGSLECVQFRFRFFKLEKYSGELG